VGNGHATSCVHAFPWGLYAPQRFYCATALDVDEAVTLEATYRFDGGDILVREL
jgi:hypothetical protein